MKKVLLIVIDALATRVVEPAIEGGRLPNLQRLRQASSLRADSIAVFPSITPAATSSLITGIYPDEHHVYGAYWYRPEAHHVVYYGFDTWAIMQKDIGDFVREFLVRLNRDFLEANTLYDEVEGAGLTAACVNYLIFAGSHQHKIDVPVPLNFVADGPDGTFMEGPATLYFGDFINSPLPHSKQSPSVPGGPFNRFGFTDRSTAELAVQLAEDGAFPDFVVAYFPENDLRSHEVGPEKALEHLRETDRLLGQIIDAFGGLEQMLSEVAVVLTGDHSQSDVIGDEEKAGIRLDNVVATHTVADIGTPMQKEDDLVICPNLRTAQIYFHTPEEQRLGLVVEELLADRRVDQVMWRADLIAPDRKGMWIATSDRGRLRFWPGEDGPNQARDRYGGHWSWDGDLATVDGEVKDDIVRFGDYPNAFERIHKGLGRPEGGHVWVTAHPGYEFHLEHMSVHIGGGSHGSLHALDSLSPLWIAGAPEDLALPTTQPRSVDVVPLCRALLGLDAKRPAGVSHLN